MSDFATKAGRRHSTADAAILEGMHGAMKAHRKARAEHDAEMDDYMKALGIEPPPDAPADAGDAPAADAAPADDKQAPPKKGVNPFAKKPAADDAPATKDIDLATLADMVEDAIVEAVAELGLWDDDDDDDDMAPDAAYADDDDDDDDHHVYVYARFAVACTARGDYQIPYSIDAGAVVIGTPDQWVRVEKLWKPIPGGQGVGATPPETDSGDISDDVPQTHVIGGAVKMMDDGSIVAQAIAYGDAEHPDMSAYSDFFTKATDLWLDQWTTRPMLYHHGQDEGTRDAPVIGTWVKAWKDDAGVWMQGQLDKSHRYAAAIKELTRRGLLRISTDSMPHLVKREAQPNGTNEIKVWPIGAASLTPTAAEPRLMTAEIKALMADLGLPIATTRADDATDRERPDGAKATGVDDLALAAAELELLLLEETL